MITLRTDSEDMGIAREETGIKKEHTDEVIASLNDCLTAYHLANGPDSVRKAPNFGRFALEWLTKDGFAIKEVNQRDDSMPPTREPAYRERPQTKGGRHK